MKPTLALKRRSLLAGSLAAGFSGVPFSVLRAAPPWSTDPFTLGVASGAPRPDRVVLWTRLAPKPLEAGGGMPDVAISVEWCVAEDEAFSRIVRSGEHVATPALAHSVHAEVAGLRPDRWYFYRFRVGMTVSPTGRTRTAPADGSSIARMRVAVASCQQYEHGHFAAYRDMAGRDLDLVVHLGDYIYENSWGSLPKVREHATPETVTTLEGYRSRHSQIKLDPSLQAVHAVAPWLSIWDDHEVANDYSSDISPADRNPASFLTTRAAAYQAYYEHMPLPASARPIGPAATIYERYRFGDLIDMVLLDDRQYRSKPVCVPPGKRTGWFNCPDRFSDGRSMLGDAQERWLDDAFRTAEGRWTVVMQQTLMSECNLNVGEGDAYMMDGWDGYASARARLLGSIAANRPSNPVVLGGDIHCFCAADLKRDFREERSEVLATEFVCTSITSEGPPVPAVRAALSQNPHLRYADGSKRGFLLMDFHSDRCEATMAAVSDVRDPTSQVTSLARMTCEAGRPGVNL